MSERTSTRQLRGALAALLACTWLSAAAPAREAYSPRAERQMLRRAKLDELAYGSRPLTRAEATALVERVCKALEKEPEPPRLEKAEPVPDDLAGDVSRLKATTTQLQNDVSGVRDDLEFHLKKERQEKERRGRTTLFGVGALSYTMTGSEANLSPIVRFPYDWDQTPYAGVTGASGRGKGFFAVDYYKLGLRSEFGPKYTLVGLMAWHPGAQANNPFSDGFQLGSPTVQGEALFVDVKDIYEEMVDVKVGYFWLPWGREVKGLLRQNPHFNSNSLYYKDGFSQANNQTGLFFSTHNKSRIQYGFGLTSGDREFSLAGTQAAAHAGNFFWQRPPAADNSRLGRYAAVRGKFNRFDWDIDYWDNGGEPGFFQWESINGGFSWGPLGRLSTSAEVGFADIVQANGRTAEWDAGYITLVWRLTADTDAALRYDHATIGDGNATTRTTTVRTVSLSHRLAEQQTLIADFSNPDSNPGFNPANPLLFPGRDLDDDLLKLSYRLVF